MMDETTSTRTPEELPLHSFAYDPFQQRAIDAIDADQTVFVAAPTGAGKTAIADYVINKTLREGRHVIYTAPIKALSNQKFRDFSSRGADRVGIMTGDVTIGSRAPLMIMTTEIYRNTLLEDPARFARVDWVIFDEIHYLDDPERGTVWEEAIMFTPQHINLLALSATIPNVEELASWIRQVHGRPVEVITETKRPVPLHVLFQCQNKILKDYQELKHQGYQNREDWLTQRRHSRYDERWQVKHNRLDMLVRHLRESDRLPAIFFTFGRRRAEDLALEASGFPLVTSVESNQLKAMFWDLCSRYQLTHDRTAQALGHLAERGVAYHHAGMLPTMKEVVEQCFLSRLVKFIVTTETFALGINMPARSVVIDTLKKRMGQRVDLLRNREYSQMSGRAGRRGMDETGYVYLRINPMQITYPEVMKVLHGTPEKVQSRFNTAYATLLNLYRRHGRQVLELFPKTLYHFQTTGARQQAGLEFMTRKLDLLEDLGYLNADGLTERGEFGSWLYGYELLLTELHAHQLLESLGPVELAVLLTAVVYEPRPSLEAPKVHSMTRRLEKLCVPSLERIHRAEERFHIKPRSKVPSFHLSAAVEAWYHGTPFARLTKVSEADEGEIVRYFRMMVQLLRQLADTPAADPALRKKAQLVVSRINRDVVDAEQQLRMG